MAKISTYYDILQVSPQASTSVIRAAFKALSQKWHPDKHPNNPEIANKKFHVIKLAYDVLSNPRLREQYDQQTIQHNRRATDVKRDPSKNNQGSKGLKQGSSKVTDRYSNKQMKTNISFIV